MTVCSQPARSSGGGGTNALPYIARYSSTFCPARRFASLESCQTGLRILRRCRGRLHHRTHADGYGFVHLGRSGRRHRRRRWCSGTAATIGGGGTSVAKRTAVVGLGGIGVLRVTASRRLLKIHLVDRPQMPPCRFVGGVDHQRLTVGGAGEFKLSALLLDPAEGVVVGRLALVARHRLLAQSRLRPDGFDWTGKQAGCSGGPYPGSSFSAVL